MVRLNPYQSKSSKITKNIKHIFLLLAVLITTISNSIIAYPIEEIVPIEATIPLEATPQIEPPVAIEANAQIEPPAPIEQTVEQTMERAKSLNLVPENLSKNYKENITREQFVRLCVALLNKFDKNNAKSEIVGLSDISQSLYQNDIKTAYKLGIVKGYTDNTFRPHNPIKREEIAVLITNLIIAINPSAIIGTTNKYVFEDSKEIGNWAEKFVFYCYEKNIMLGTGGNRVSPRANSTVEQAITLIVKVFEFINTTNNDIKQSLTKEAKIMGTEYESFKLLVGNEFAEVIESTYNSVYNRQDFVFLDVNSKSTMIFNFNDNGNISQTGIYASIYKNKDVEEGKLYGYFLSTEFNTKLTSNDCFTKLLKYSKKYEKVLEIYNKKIDELNANKTLEAFNIQLEEQGQSYIVGKLTKSDSENGKQKLEFTFVDIVLVKE